jgi:hypothetical protein
MTKKITGSVSLGVSLITNSVIDEIANKIRKLDIDDDAIGLVWAVLDEARTVEADFGTSKPKKSRVSISDRPKRVIPAERQCQGLKKDGKPCTAPKASDIFNRCWSHMTKDQRTAHQDIKASVKEPPAAPVAKTATPGRKKYTVKPLTSEQLRAIENSANE